MSSTNDFDFNIEEILAEFGSDSPEPAGKEARPEQPAPAPAAVRPTREPPAEEPAPEPPAPEEPVPEAPERRSRRRERPAPSPPPAPPAEDETADEDEDEAREEKPRRTFGSVVLAALRILCGGVFAVLAALVLFWMVLHVHPDAGPSSTVAGRAPLDLMPQFDAYVNNTTSDALSELTYIRKKYSIPENATVAPAPDQDKFHTTDDPQEVMDVIASASELLEGQEVAFDPNADFQEGKPIHYYYDETILAIVWKEIIEGKCCTCAEVKVADGSQIRRKLADDSYGSSIQLYATAMSKEVNSVVTLSGDFYAFRNLGITVYQRQVYRCNPGRVDSCFVTASGDLLFSYAGELMEKEEAQAFVDDNDVLFGLAFGPVLVDNGELRTVTRYPIGEIDRTYSRTALGMLDKLHYFCMTINYDTDYRVAATLAQLGQFMYDKGCVKAYNLDGGQTSVIAVQGEAINHIDVINGQSERVVSDIIYFATAFPEQEAGA